MLLRLQKYDLIVTYKKGTLMFIADTLSRAYLPTVNVCAQVVYDPEFEEVDHQAFLAISDHRWKQFDGAAKSDPVQQQLRNVIRQGWPAIKTDVPESLHPYFGFRDELTTQGHFIFKGHQLVVPAALRKEIMKVTHSSHIGIEGCLRRARESLYWPRMAAELKDYISACDVCLSHRQGQTKEPLLQHEFIAQPWSKLGVDLAHLDNRNLLVLVDYFSNFIEVARLNSTTSRSVIRELEIIFGRFGVPDTVLTDNGPQFASTEFAVFAKNWGFNHVTSSPHHPQSNGKAENAVKTIKRLFTKCKASGQSEFMALLDWRNTPTEGFTTSPAQRLLGRRCRTLLPIAGSLLQPNSNHEQDSRSLLAQKLRQQIHHDKGTKSLTTLKVGDTVRMKLPGQHTWSQGTCMGHNVAGPRSYDVRVEGATYRRNRRDLLATAEPPLLDLDTAVPECEEEKSQEEMERRSVSEQKSADQVNRRSCRERHPPKYLNDYIV